jgi:hypothetical protein
MIQLELSMMGRSGNKITHVTQFIIIAPPCYATHAAHGYFSHPVLTSIPLRVID